MAYWRVEEDRRGRLQRISVIPPPVFRMPQATRRGPLDSVPCRAFDRLILNAGALEVMSESDAHL